MCLHSCGTPAFGCCLLGAIQYTLCNLVCLQVEVDTNEDISEEYLLDELHPKIHLHQPLFAKPKGPQNQRGLRRINQQPV